MNAPASAPDPASAPTTYDTTVSITGVIAEGPIQLVSATSANQMLQVVGAVVGSLGGIILGAGISPMVVEKNTIPEATRAIAAQCVAEGKNCDALTFASRDFGTAFLVIGGLLTAIQFGLLLWSYFTRRSLAGSAKK